MELLDEQWQWDDSRTVQSTSESLQNDIDSDLLLATGASTPSEARRLFVERSKQPVKPFTQFSQGLEPRP
jgi:hypothetical protein